MTKTEIVTKLAEAANIQKKQAEKVVASLRST
jgi:nucleoid DNA-binding protein